MMANLTLIIGVLAVELVAAGAVLVILLAIWKDKKTVYDPHLVELLRTEDP